MVTKPAFSPALLIMFLAFSFGTGFLLVTASQQNTEGRSKAFGSVYNPNLNACMYVINGECSENPPKPPGATCTYAEPGVPDSCGNCQYGPPNGLGVNNPESTCPGPPLNEQAANAVNQFNEWISQGFSIFQQGAVGGSDTKPKCETGTLRQLPGGSFYCE